MAGEDKGKSDIAAASAHAPKRSRKPIPVAPIGGAAQAPAAIARQIAGAPAKAALHDGPALDAASAPAEIAAPLAEVPLADPVPQPQPLAHTPAAGASGPAPLEAKPAPLQTKKIKAAISTAPVPGKTPPSAAPSLTIPHFTKKDFIMDMTSSYKSGFQDVFVDVQDKAKEAFEKGSSMLGEVGDFTRGNVEAMVESGKILASGLQDMGTSFAAESRSAFEVMTADLKDLAAAKTPADFLKIQSEIIRKSFDGAVAYGSKNSEAVLKLATEAVAPITGRVSLAVEKARASA